MASLDMKTHVKVLLKNSQWKFFVMDDGEQLPVASMPGSAEDVARRQELTIANVNSMCNAMRNQLFDFKTDVILGLYKGEIFWATTICMPQQDIDAGYVNIIPPNMISVCKRIQAELKHVTDVTAETEVFGQPLGAAATRVKINREAAKAKAAATDSLPVASSSSGAGKRKQVPEGSSTAVQKRSRAQPAKLQTAEDNLAEALADFDKKNGATGTKLAQIVLKKHSGPMTQDQFCQKTALAIIDTPDGVKEMSSAMPDRELTPSQWQEVFNNPKDTIPMSQCMRMMIYVYCAITARCQEVVASLEKTHRQTVTDLQDALEERNRQLIEQGAPTVEPSQKTCISFDDD